MSSGIYGVIIDQDNYITGTVQPGGSLIGWEYDGTPSDGYCWHFRRDISEFFDATEVAGVLTIKGLETSSGAALIRWNNTPMTDEQLDQVEKDDGLLLTDPIGPATGQAGNKQGERELAWTVEAGLPMNTGYQGAQIGAAVFFGFEGGNANEALIYYLQKKLISTNTSIVGLQAETAAALGVPSWNGVGYRISEL